MRLSAAAAAVAALALAVVSVQPAHASRYLRLGIFDQGATLYGGETAFADYAALHVKELRVNLVWASVAKTRPAAPNDPADPAYDWSTYDAAARAAAADGIHLLLSIVGTPRWANGGQSQNVAPTSASDLQSFAVAAATRYSGSFSAGGSTLPAERDWTAWNEPNNPVFLAPQWHKTGSHWTIVSATAYAKICNAVYAGVHSLGYSSERVACGVTAPRGNNAAASARASVSPLAFLRAVKKAGLRTFDAWAHNPYYSKPSETPTTKPSPPNGAKATAVVLGNLSALTATLNQLYGHKRIWITEYGYQTKPPDSVFGVTYAKQAQYLTQAVAIARANPRVDMMLWFLLRDEQSLGGWQSGLLTLAGAQKPAFAAFSRAAGG
jgi:putative glycosyl hydrolase